MLLGKLLESIEYTNLKDFQYDTEITGLCYDSRKVQSGDLFVCIKGYLQGKLYLLVVDIDAFLLFHKSALFNGNLRAIYGNLR